MKTFLITALGLMISLTTYSQSSMPAKIYQTMVDSTTSIDVVFYDEDGGSISADGKDVSFFNYFFSKEASVKAKAKAGGSVMWLIKGREYLSGTFYLGDSTGYLVTKKDDKEYVNKITPTGFNFLNGGYKKH